MKISRYRLAKDIGVPPRRINEIDKGLRAISPDTALRLSRYFGIVAEFVENYTEMLETGITRNLYETFSPFGLDPELPEFWESGLALINKYLDELIQHDDKKPAPKTKAPAKKPPPPGL